MRALLLTALCLAAACGDNSGPATSDLDVTIDSGPIHGEVEGNVRAFFGVPYAAPPVGPLRWKLPQPVAPWTTPLQAVSKGSACPQKVGFTGPSFDEDCLYLNVWTPHGVTNAPVFLWLHGGAFIFGSGNDPFYDGEHLADTFGVVVITINYRLGALGFLAHDALDAEDATYPTSGNYGIEDQFAAIQWVQRNAAAFGGDPTKVALAGESAGGNSACLHYLAPRTAGLFAVAISESGLCTSVELPKARARERGADLATALGCGPGSDVPSCLRGKTVEELLDATTIPLMGEPPGGPLYNAGADVFLPNIDGVTIASSVADGLAAGTFSPRPLLLGTNHDEGTLFHSDLFATPVVTEDDYEGALTKRFGAAMVPAIVARYPIASFADGNHAIAQVTGDSLFVCPARRMARGVVAHAPVFRYTFAQPLENPLFVDGGVVHSAELSFVFGNDDGPLGSIGQSGAAVATALQGYWMRFSAAADPNGDGAVAWPAYAAANDPYLTIATPIAAGAGLETDACDLWDTIPILPP